MGMAARSPTPRQQVLGVVLSVIVAAIWVSSSELIQYILRAPKSSYDRPFAVSFLSTSLFAVLLVGFFRRAWRSRLGPPPVEYTGLPPRSAYTPDGITANATDADAVSASAAPAPLTVREVAVVAAHVAPLYFLANYSFNAGLGMTSVASSSSISTSSTLFTLVIGCLMGVERFSAGKLVACFLTIAGTTIIGRQDGQKGTRSLLGDGVSVLSAFIFGLYTNVLKHQLGGEERADVSMMFAFVGLFSVLFAWPGFPLLSALGIEPFALPGWRVLGLLILNGLVGSVLSDVLWAKAVVLTSPLLGSIGLSLTAPLALLVDFSSGKIKVAPPYLAGACLVLAGFLLINVELALDEKRRTANGDVS